MKRRKFIELSLAGTSGIMAMPFLGGVISCNLHNEKDIRFMEPDKMTDLLWEFTETYKKYHDNIFLREAYCNQIQWKGMVRPIQESDLFAGRLIQNPIGFTGQSVESSMGYYFHEKAIEQLISDPKLSLGKKEVIEELVKFWKQENTVFKAKKAFSDEMKAALPSDYYFSESGIAFTLWRMSGIQLDYKKLIKLGIGGLRDEVKRYEKNTKVNSPEADFYKSLIIALDTFSEICLYYSEMAKTQALQSNDPERKTELEIMSKTLKNISKDKPSNFREALQLMYLYNIVDGTRNYGRMDDYLGDIYIADLQAGRINEEEAIRLLTGIWALMRDRNFRYDTRLIIGGKGRENEANADQVALLIMETSNQVREIVPQIALRFHKDQNPELYKKGLDVLGTGYTFPMLYNDDVNIPAVQKAFEVPYEEAIHAIQYGCGEYVLNHRSVGTPSGVINLLQALLVTLNKGIDPVTGNSMGMPVQQYLKYDDFKTFEDLFGAYKEQVEYHVKYLAQHEELEYVFAGKDNPYLYTSMLMDDCIKSGKPIFSGGIRYLGGTLEAYGNSNAADSLLAIKKLVYDLKVISLEKLREILAADFNGYEKEMKMMKECPKYGNDNDEADEMLIKVHEHVCKFTRDQKNHTNLHSYLIVIINNDANTVMGKYTPASPDGRKAYTYLNPGNNPSSGADKNGVTAFLNSIAKPDPSIHAGAVQNMKFSKELFTQNRAMLEALLFTYFSQGGTQAMLTVISRNHLEEAILHPENYQNLIVRVGGFSERFVNLPHATQQEILARTIY